MARSRRQKQILKWGGQVQNYLYVCKCTNSWHVCYYNFSYCHLLVELYISPRRYFNNCWEIICYKLLVIICYRSNLIQTCCVQFALKKRSKELNEARFLDIEMEGNRCKVDFFWTSIIKKLNLSVLINGNFQIRKFILNILT